MAWRMPLLTGVWLTLAALSVWVTASNARESAAVAQTDLAPQQVYGDACPSTCPPRIPLEATSPEDNVSEVPPLDPPDPQSNEFVEQICASEDVRRALRSLTARERQVVVLAFWDGMSERAIAEKLGIALSTVCVYKERALRKLRRAVGFAG